MNKFRIESRWPKWAKWKIVTPLPHAERNEFDSKGLFWPSMEEAMTAKVSFETVNEGEFRIVEEIA